MDINDILTLAKAGFTAEQISLLNAPSPQEATTAPQEAPPASQEVITAQQEVTTAPQDALNAIMSRLDEMESRFQSAAIATSNIITTKQESAQDILANIIAPIPASKK